MTYYDTSNNTIRSSIRSKWAASFPGGQPLGMARRAIDASDWRLRTRAGSLWSAIRSIWRSAVHRRFGVQADGVAQPQGWGQQQQLRGAASSSASFRNRTVSRGRTATGAGPASDPGPGTATAWPSDTRYGQARAC